VAYATHHDCTTKIEVEDKLACEAASSTALRAIMTKMMSSSSTRWSPTSLTGETHPAGFLVAIKGPHATDPTCLRYLAAAAFVGTKADYNPTNPFHLVGFPGSSMYTRGNDLDGRALVDGTLSVTSISYNDKVSTSSPTHFKSIPSLKKPSCTKALKEQYPTVMENITSSINALLRSSVAADSC